MQPPPPATRENEIEQAVAALKRASISYNAPTTLHLGETVEIQLLLAPRKTVTQLKKELTAIGERRGRQVKFSNRMAAHLDGTHFNIDPVGGTTEVQAVNPGRTTEWRWLVEPTRTGQQKLELTVSAFVFADGESTAYRFNSFETTLTVNVTWPDRLRDFVSTNWQWLWGVIVFPIVAWLVHNRKRWLWRFRAGPPPAPPTQP